MVDHELLHILSDQRRIEAMCDFEAAVAEALAEHGVIPMAAAKSIRACCAKPAPLTEASVAAVVRYLKSAVDEAAVEWVHFGLSDGDVLDSAMGHVLGDGCSAVLRRVGQLCHRLAELTRVQQTLTCAQWLDGLVFCHDRLQTMSSQWLQLGGPSGTFAQWGLNALDVYQSLLKAGVMPQRPHRSWWSFTGRDVPWPANRAHHQLLGAQLGVLCSTLGRIDEALTRTSETSPLLESAQRAPLLVAQLLGPRQLALEDEWSALCQLVLSAGELTLRLQQRLTSSERAPAPLSSHTQVLMERVLARYQEEKTYMESP
jgi:3-carboxy-cis,cis-muconate cycloisomerase